jgi:hypothetical protein
MKTQPAEGNGRPSPTSRQPRFTDSVNGKIHNAIPPEKPESTPPETNLAVALRLAAAGIYVFPCAEVSDVYHAVRKGKRVLMKEKEPFGAWSSVSTTSPALIKAMWEKHPKALPAIDVGKSGLFVVDPDRHENSPDGVAAWAALCAEHGHTVPPNQPVVDTPTNGGKHLYHRPPDGVRLGNREGAIKDRGVNVRGEGGYVIAPGATFPDGRAYRMADGSPDLVEMFAQRREDIPEVPAWLVALLRANRTERDRNAAPQPMGPVGARERAFAAKALAENAKELAETQEGGRNIKLNAVSFRMGRLIGAGWIDRDTVERAFEAACVENELARPFCYHGSGGDEVARTMDSGINAGLKEPHEPLPLKPGLFSAPEREVVEQDGVLIDAETGEVLGQAPRDEAPSGDADRSAPPEGPPAPNATGGNGAGSSGGGGNGFDDHAASSAQPTGAGDYADDYADEILKLPGLVSDIAHWILSASRVPQKRFAVAAAIIIVGLAAARHLKTPTRSQLNIYMLLIAKTANGKDAPLTAAKNILRAARLREMIGPAGGASDISVYLHCHAYPVTLLPIDEFGDILAANNAHNASSHAQKLNAAYKIMWSGGQVPVPKAASRGNITLDDPFVSMMASSTPKQFFNAVSSKQAEDGLLNRMLMISVEKFAPFNKKSGDIGDVPVEIAERLRSLANRPGAHGGDPRAFRAKRKKAKETDDEDDEETVIVAPPQSVVVPWDGEKAEAFFDAYADEERAMIEKDERRATFGPRCAENALKVATILAVSQNPHQPAVDLRCLRLGKLLAEASFSDMTRGFERHVPDSKNADMQDKIMQIIRGQRDGVIGRTDLFRSVRRAFTSRNDFDNVVEVLVDAEMVEALNVTPKNGGPAKACLRVVDKKEE